MKTKIVYCLVSGYKDIYLEQVWMSLYSLRLYNPNAHVSLFVDIETSETLKGSRNKIKELIANLIVLDTPEGYNSKERSRYIKTNFRQFITGDVLFIDADTIICGALNEIDNISEDIACVPDYHVKFKDIPNNHQLSKRIFDVFNIETRDAEYYFNSGVIYVKDTPKMRAFFSDWYHLWEYSSFEKNCSFDQPALFAADKKNGYVIKQLKGIFNCQILYSIEHLPNALILHFFNTILEGKETFSPFFEDKLYKDLKTTGEITPFLGNLIRNCKSSFKSPTYLINREQYQFLTSPVGVGLYSHFKAKSFIYRLLLKYCLKRIK